MNTKRVWFTSDTHFGHEKIILHCDRPFMDAADRAACKDYTDHGKTLPSEWKLRLEDATAYMDRTMVEKWNATVAPEDDVWHLGDFSLSRRRVAGDYLPHLNGRLHLIRGNHDAESTWAHPRWVFSECYAETRVAALRLVLFHYGMRHWNGSFGGKAIQLHGHSHGGMSPIHNQCDVGVDVWDFRPVSAGEIVARVETTNTLANGGNLIQIAKAASVSVYSPKRFPDPVDKGLSS